MPGAALLKIENLSVSFPAPDGSPLFAVRKLSFTARESEITCLVGESGCGKSLTCKSVLRLTPENAALEGGILFGGRNLLELPPREMRAIRGRHIAAIFQEPMTSLNPVMKVGEQVAEALRWHLRMSRRQAREEAVRLFAEAGIPAPEKRYDDYPHQLSGGMRQRVMIAIALSCKPRLLLADEPTTALDATIQGQILRLIREQSRERGMAVLLITHDLGVVSETADYVGVMYAGILVEKAPADRLFARPLHPYTRGLMAAAPTLASAGAETLHAIPGAVPSLGEMPPGCPFAPRCGQAMEICRRELPAMAWHDGREGHGVACFAV